MHHFGLLDTVCMVYGYVSGGSGDIDRMGRRAAGEAPNQFQADDILTDAPSCPTERCIFIAVFQNLWQFIAVV